MVRVREGKTCLIWLSVFLFLYIIKKVGVVYFVKWPWPVKTISEDQEEIKLELLDKQKMLALNTTVQVVNDLR